MIARSLERAVGKLKDMPGCLSPPTRRAAVMAVDAFIVAESFVVALLFRFDGGVPESYWKSFWPFAVASVVAFVALNYQSGVYRNVLRYTGIYQGIRLASATAIASGVLVVANVGLGLLWSSRPVPLSVILVGAVLAYVQLMVIRLYPRVFYEYSLREVGQRERALIVGAGEAGVALARQLFRTPDADLRPVGFVGEGGELRGEHIEGVPVLGGPEDIERLVEEQAIGQILIALPTASPEQMERVWNECKKTSAEVKVVPTLTETLSRGAIQVRELRIQDLLGREPVDIDLDALTKLINGRRVLVTGAGGSIGRELSRQVLRLGPARLVLLDRDESALYYLDEELRRESFSGFGVVVADVTDADRVSTLFERERPQLVFHAAAYKHVPLMELHATEAISNNVGGTLSVARAAGEHGAERFINISTDKAVNPTNVMGATKRLSEGIVRATAEEYPETIYASVRFGNVLGSRGSVVPTFRRQIEAGGPVTVTHPDIRRYFMAIPEAVSLVLQAGAMSDAYGTYILEMGRPVMILDLAEKMLEIMGAKNVRIQYTGLRPGEKLQEELVEEGERQLPTDHPMVFRLLPNGHQRQDVIRYAGQMLYHARRQDTDRALELLYESVPSYSIAGAPSKE